MTVIECNEIEVVLQDEKRRTNGSLNENRFFIFRESPALS
jgi:hypothetical protein